MSIARRIAKLERRDGPGCSECRIRPTSTYVVYPDEDDQTDHVPEPERCPSCGRLIERCLLRVVYDG